MLALFLMFFYATAGAEICASFYLVRHGESEANRDGILQGQSNFALTVTGIIQAQNLGRAISDIRFHSVFSSDLERAVDTCDIILRESLVPPVPLHVKTHLLRERRFGPRECLPVGTTMDEAKEMVAKRLNIQASDVVDGSESTEELEQRSALFFHSALDNLQETSSPSGEGVPRILVVSHSAFIKGVLHSHLDKQIPKVKNCSISKILVKRDESGGLSFSCNDDEINVDRHNLESTPSSSS